MASRNTPLGKISHIPYEPWSCAVRFHDEYVMTGTLSDQRVMAEFAGRYGVESICTVDGSRGPTFRV
ncbi:hypothetical protein [Natronorubrum thiooxidans]|uniref:hypothetical protein n=1 Tax=Natronorubrum thiooxidans TaxID=308853 RepID=UPI00117EA3E7|nr:hypothetical protein [Natronorubrum thiooxidans]